MKANVKNRLNRIRERDEKVNQTAYPLEKNARISFATIAPNNELTSP